MRDCICFQYEDSGVSFLPNLPADQGKTCVETLLQTTRVQNSELYDHLPWIEHGALASVSWLPWLQRFRNRLISLSYSRRSDDYALNRALRDHEFQAVQSPQSTVSMERDPPPPPKRHHTHERRKKTKKMGLGVRPFAFPLQKTMLLTAATASVKFCIKIWEEQGQESSNQGCLHRPPDPESSSAASKGQGGPGVKMAPWQVAGWSRRPPHGSVSSITRMQNKSIVTR